MGKFFVMILACMLLAVGVFAQEYKAVVPQVAPAAIDAFSKSIQAIVESEGKKAVPQTVPFARAVYMLEAKQADMLVVIVQIPDQTKWADLKYDYSTDSLLSIVFVLYTNKAKPVTVAELKAGNPKGYKIETDTAHTLHFPVAVGSTSIDASLKKLEEGTIDGFIFSQGSTDVALKRLALKNIKREYFDTLNGVFGLQKGARGGPTDKMLSAGLAKIKANGKYKELIGAYSDSASKYLDWQQ